MRACCDNNTTLLTGGPLDNLASALSKGGFELGRWVAQGGFAGEGVVPPHLQMDKFKGRTFNRTFNFGQNPHAAKIALASTAISRRVCVSKNVCHRTLYDDSIDGWHRAVAREVQRLENQAQKGQLVRANVLQFVHDVMNDYLSHKRSGKMIHDPLALAVALDESVCTLSEVRLHTEHDAWGAKPCKGSGTWISIDYDEAKFKATLLNDGFQRVMGNDGFQRVMGDDFPSSATAPFDNEASHWPALGQPEQTCKTNRRWKRRG